MVGGKVKEKFLTSFESLRRECACSSQIDPYFQLFPLLHYPHSYTLSGSGPRRALVQGMHAVWTPFVQLVWMCQMSLEPSWGVTPPSPQEASSLGRGCPQLSLCPQTTSVVSLSYELRGYGQSANLGNCAPQQENACFSLQEHVFVFFFKVCCITVLFTLKIEH